VNNSYSLNVVEIFAVRFILHCHKKEQFLDCIR